MVALVSGCELLQQGGEAAFLQPLVPANTDTLSLTSCSETSHRMARMEPGHAYYRAPRQQRSWGQPEATPCHHLEGHSPFEVGSYPHVGHLPAHSCNEREDNQSLPRQGWALEPRAAHHP